MSHSIEEFEKSPFFATLCKRRNRCLLFNIFITSLFAVMVMALHIEPISKEGESSFLGYHVHFAFDRWQTYFWLGALALFGIFWINRSLKTMFSDSQFIEIYPNDLSNNRSFGSCDAMQIVQMTLRLAQKMKINNVAKIYVFDTPDPNAYTARVFGVGEVVFLHRNLVELINPAGVEAIIAHELGHVRRMDSVHRQLANIPKNFLHALGFILAWKLAGGLFLFSSLWELFLRLSFIGIVGTGMALLLRIVKFLEKQANRAEEFIADSYAAWACGMEPIFNALLLLGERFEAILALRLRLDGHPILGAEKLDDISLLHMLERVSMVQLDEQSAGTIARLLYIETQITVLRDRLLLPFDDNQVFELAKQADAAWENRLAAAIEIRKAEEANETPDQKAAREKTEAENSRKWAEAEQLLLQWRSHDTDASGHLDKNECAAFIATLMKDPKRLLFRQDSGGNERDRTHPTMRQRLISIYAGFGKD